METTKRWNSCRLVIYENTGRVRWCVGKESTWKCKVKILAIIPIILLTIVAVPIFYRLHSQSKDETGRAIQPGELTTSYRDSEILDNDEREILNNIRTSYIPSSQNPQGSDPDYGKARNKRDLTLLTNLNYDFSPPDDADFQDNESPEPKILKLKFFSPPVDKVMNLQIDDNVKREDLEKDFHYWKDKITKQQVRKKQAHIMQMYMNPEVDPCTDFYQFACGNWEKHNPIPPDKAGYDTFERLRESLDTVLRDILSEEDSIEADKLNKKQYVEAHGKTYGTNLNDTLLNVSDGVVHEMDPFIKAKKLYKSCINEAIINQRAEKPLLQLIEKFGGWPVIDDNWNETQFNWIWLIGQLRLYNNDILLSEWIGPDIKNSNQHIIQLDQTTLGLPTRDYFLEESNIKYLEAYRIYMITAANLLGAPIIRATQDADRMIDFETNLALITASQYERRNLTEIYARMTVGELQAKIPQIDWMPYLNMVIGAEIGPDEPIVCFCLKYVQELTKLMSRTPPRTIANYILWRFIRHRMNNLDIRFLEAKQRFYFVLYGREQLPPRWQTCVSQVNSNMGMALGHLFVKKYYDEKSKNDTIIMTKGIQNAFYNILSDVQWLDRDTKTLAQMKIRAMQLRIGYPDYILDKAELSRKYLNVKIDENLYFENTLSILKHLTYAEQMRLNTSVNRTIWNTPPAVVNAYYSRNKNQIMFPAGILQPPFYHRHFPRSLNYGGIGVVIGHEITHGFDDKGRLFDKEGNLQRWWKDSSIDAFHDRSQCLIDQYNGYIVPEVGIAIDGINTQGENIADNGGIKQAFRAYREWEKRNPHADEALPGIKMSSEQLFFLNFAQVWCGVSRPEALRNKLKTAVHSPGRFRVIGTIRNSEDFSEAFRCPLGSPMNPRNKCIIW